MNLQTIGEHTIDIDLLTGSIAIDVGCLGFDFSVGMRKLGCEVHAFDLIEMDVPRNDIYFSVAAITHEDKEVKVLNTPDRQAWHISAKGQILVNSISLNKLYKFFTYERPDCVDVLKLDCEGSEYFILSDPEFQPVPRMLSIEFHEHCHKNLHNHYFDKCMENILRHYDIVQHKRTQAHGSGFNYWDSLFVRKDLA